MSAGKPNPLVGFHFSLEVQGKITGYFTEVSGVGSENEITEFKAMEADGKKQVVMQVPGRLKWGAITLKRGVTGEMDLDLWRKEIENGGVDSARKNGSLVMYDQSGKEVARWNFVNAYPSKVDGPSMKADDNSVVTVSYTLVHEGIERVS